MHIVMWMSYDLGVKGDYEGLYAWLDDHDAKECGNSVAFLRYEYSANFLSELKEDIARHVNLDTRDRVYIIWREEQKNTRPVFIRQEEGCPMGRFRYARGSSR